MLLLCGIAQGQNISATGLLNLLQCKDTACYDLVLVKNGVALIESAEGDTPHYIYYTQQADTLKRERLYIKKHNGNFAISYTASSKANYKKLVRSFSHLDFKNIKKMARRTDGSCKSAKYPNVQLITQSRSVPFYTISLVNGKIK